MSLRVFFLTALMVALALNPIFCQNDEDASNSTAEATTTGQLISGVPALKWADGMCMFMGSLNTCLNHLGEKTTYPYLMGVSGTAFATRFLPGWCESSSDAALNDDHPSAALQAVGYSYSWSVSGNSSVVKQSIDRGVPVIAIDPTGSGDWGIIVGHERMGEIWVCHTYYNKPTEYHRTEKLPWSVLILGKKGKAPSMAQNVQSSIKLAVEFGKGERKLKDYAVGFNAYNAWIEALQPKNCQSLTGKKLEDTAYINAWLYNCLIDARHAGVTYLTWAATQLKGEDRLNCEQAAALYQEEIDILKGVKDYIKYPQTIKSGPKWSADMRAYEIEALKQALEKDKAAVTALEKISKTNEDRPVNPE